jgi:hypothetical protein
VDVGCCGGGWLVRRRRSSSCLTDIEPWSVTDPPADAGELGLAVGRALGSVDVVGSDHDVGVSSWFRRQLDCGGLLLRLRSRWTSNGWDEQGGKFRPARVMFLWEA